MAAVIDANLLVALVLDDNRAPVVREQWTTWARVRELIHAPALARYEVASAFTQLLGAGHISVADVAAGAAALQRLSVTYHFLDDIAGAVAIAARLGRRSAYDAAYVALAAELAAELWTFDGPLARNAASAGFAVHLLSADR